MRFTIITPTIGRDSLIRACRSVDLQDHGEWQHIVVLDGEDWPESLVRQIRHPQRLLLNTGARVGDSGNTPRRLAGEHATGNYILYLDDDNFYLRTSVLSELSAELTHEQPEWAIVRVASRTIPAEPQPRIGEIDSANLIHRPTIRGEPIRWPDTRDYVADGQLGVHLQSLAQPFRLACDPAVRYERANHGEWDRRPAIVTAVEETYFPWFRWWWHSVRDHVDWPIYASDMGLQHDQRAWCLAQGITLLRPDDRFEFLSADHWLRNIWICIGPALDLRSHQRVWWCGCDTLVLQHPEVLFRERFTVFRETFAPECVANPPELYEQLPVPVPVHPECRLNADVIIWEQDRDQSILSAWREIYEMAAIDETTARNCAWGPQGSLIWALHRAGCPDIVVDEIRCNQPANGLRVDRMRERRRYANEPALIERVRHDHPEAVVVHWMGKNKPWADW